MLQYVSPRSPRETISGAEEEIAFEPEPFYNVPRRPADPGHVVHYPLCGLDLDFARYHHRRLGPGDVMVHNMVQDLLFPRRVKQKLYERPIPQGPHETWSVVKPQDRALGMDIKAVDRMLHTSTVHRDLDARRAAQRRVAGLLTPTLGVRKKSPTRAPVRNCDFIWDIVQRYYFENLDPGMRKWLRDDSFDALSRTVRPTHGRADGGIHHGGLDKGDGQHIKSYKAARTVHQEYSVYSGPELNLPRRQLPWYYRDALGDDPVMPPLRDVHSRRRRPLNYAMTYSYADNSFDVNSSGLGRPRLTRSQSLPRPGTRNFAAIANRWEHLRHVAYPSLSLQELDRRSRRRSLSRRHIADMFVDRPPKIEHFRITYRRVGSERKDVQMDLIDFPRHGQPLGCENCGLPFHDAELCALPCGRCGDTKKVLGQRVHLAPACPAPSRNLCKCSPLPNFHLAQDCNVKCSRRCGNPHPPGDFRHKNAMLCKARCCMCGVPGHSGRDCRQQRCGCGGAHLGQDCGWKPTCRVQGCPRYVCHRHCRECGSWTGPLVGGHCDACLKNGRPVAPSEPEVQDRRKPRLRWLPNCRNNIDMYLFVLLFRHGGNPPEKEMREMQMIYHEVIRIRTAQSYALSIPL